MSRIGTASPGMRLVMMLVMYVLSMLALAAGFTAGVMLASGPWHEGDMAALIEERGIADLFSGRQDDAAVFALGAERLLANSPVLGVFVVSGESVLYQRTVDKQDSGAALAGQLGMIRHEGRIIRHGDRLLYAWSPAQRREVRVVLQISGASRPWRAALSTALSRLGGLPDWSLVLGMAGFALVCTLMAWGLAWFFHSRQLSRFLSTLEACEALEDLSGHRLFGCELGGPLSGCVGRLVQSSDQAEKRRFDSLLPRRRGYDFPGFDAATVYAGGAESPALHVDIRPLGNGRYGIMLLAVNAGDESEEALVRMVTACDACFSLYQNPAQVASALNRYMHSMAIPFPVDAGFMFWTPAEKVLEFCLGGSVTLLRYDVREGVMRGYDLKQPALEGIEPEGFDAHIGFARLEVGDGDPLVLTFGPGVEWQHLVSEVLKKSTTLAERQQTLAGLLSQRIEAGRNAAALLMSLS